MCLFDCLCVPKAEFHLSSFNCMYVLGVNCIHLYGKLVLCTLVHKTSLNVLGVNCIHLYGKLVLCTLIHKTSLMVNNKRNVHGQNI